MTYGYPMPDSWEQEQEWREEEEREQRRIANPIRRIETTKFEQSETTSNQRLKKISTDQLTGVIGECIPLQYNELTNRIENAGKEIDGDFLGTLYLQLAELHHIKVSKTQATDAALLIARRHSFHPVQDYLNGLNENDQLPIEVWRNLASYCFGTNSSESTRDLHRQLIGLVARAMKPGCKLDTSLIIHSDQQGIGKSSFWSILGGDWFSDSLGDLRNLKDDVLQLHSAWIHEWGEIDRVMGKRDSESLKRFITARQDDVRKPYGRGVERLHRSCGIIGTTNRRDFIKDHTGNRRFPIISINKVDLNWVEDNRDAIWASAFWTWSQGEKWHYSQEENEVMSKAAQDFASKDPLREQLESWLEDNPKLVEIPVAHALISMGYIDQKRDKSICAAMARHFQSLGWTPSKQRSRYQLPNGMTSDKTTGWCRPGCSSTPI